MEISLGICMWMLGLKNLGYDLKVPNETNSYCTTRNQRGEHVHMQ